MAQPIQKCLLIHLSLWPALASLVLAGAISTSMLDATGRLSDSDGTTGGGEIVRVTPNQSLGDVSVREVLPVAEVSEIFFGATAPTIRIAVDDQGKEPVGIATIFPRRSDIEINSRSSVATLLFWTREVQTGTTNQERLTRLGSIVLTPEFDQLVQHLDREEVSLVDIGPADLAPSLSTLRNAVYPECGVVCSEKLGPQLLEVHNHDLVPIDLVQPNGSVCLTVAPAALTGGRNVIKAATAALAGEELSVGSGGLTFEFSSAIASSDNCGEVVEARTSIEGVQGRSSHLLEMIFTDWWASPENGIANPTELLDFLGEQTSTDSISEATIDLLLGSTWAIDPQTVNVGEAPPSADDPQVVLRVSFSTEHKSADYESSNDYTYQVSLTNNGTGAIVATEVPWSIVIDGAEVPSQEFSDSVGANVVIRPGESITGTVRFSNVSQVPSMLQVRFQGDISIRTEL